jgi:2-polyprenyl-3-methyl-5-hydroxy-6-metoxy-1,4-benzoquinol methylase
MSSRKPIVENGVIAGNLENKYEAKNPISRWLMAQFLRRVTELVRQSACQRAHEVGCGEGLLSLHLHRELGLDILGTDVSGRVVEEARSNARAAGAGLRFEAADVYTLDVAVYSRELVICCEVLEHLEDPRRALRRLCELTTGYLVLSVPREPLWRGMNVARGRHLRRWGNTPGHLQNWSQSAFLELIDREAEIVEIRSPIPWSMVLARPRAR